MGFLKTRWTDRLDRQHPLPEYPRPQLERADWISLNGIYEYAVTELNCCWPEHFDGQIVVPYAIESMLSGVQKPLLPDQKLWYKKTFVLPDTMQGRHILLNFEAVDWACTVYINRKNAGSHVGGYTAFSLDITDLLHGGENELVIAVTDPTDEGHQQRGKQVLKPHDLWYTATSGIWQSVWLEAVSECHITKLRMVPDIDRGLLKLQTDATRDDCSVRVTVYAGSERLSVHTVSTDAEIPFENLRLWSPEDPFLYDLKIELLWDGAVTDTVKSYVGMRKCAVGRDSNGIPRFFLNNKPYFQKGLLDQGYWSDGGMTPAADDALVYDIATMKRLGFNMLRKHIKVELGRWYYYCDRLGMLVWQDMVSGGKFAGMFLNNYLPNMGFPIKDRHYHLFRRNKPEWREEFERELLDMMEQLQNHPCVCCWVPFNEGWGQFDAARITQAIQDFDPTRPVDHASGWHDQGAGDFISIHRYKYRIKLPKMDGRVFVLSEYGGYSRIAPGHVWNTEKSFGYLLYDTKEALTKAYRELHEQQIIPLIEKSLSAVVYTQLTDVEDEVNGLMTYDREQIKVEEAVIMDINQKLTLCKEA